MLIWIIIILLVLWLLGFFDPRFIPSIPRTGNFIHVLIVAEDDLQKALDAMSEHQLRRIPVVDNDNKILGIIARAYVATRVNQPEKTVATVKEISRSKAR